MAEEECGVAAYTLDFASGSFMDREYVLNPMNLSLLFEVWSL